MSMSIGAQPLQPEDEVQEALREIRQETTMLALPGICLAGFITILAAKLFADPVHGGLAGLTLLLLPILVWTLRQFPHRVAAWTLVGGLVLAVLVPVVLGETLIINLIVWPVGLATLLIGVGGGVGTALVSSLLILALPAVGQDISFLARTMILGQIWGMIWLIWLTAHPLVTAIEWFQTSYRQSCTLLEQTRDYQLQLSQTLEDLANANLQLTRLNRLAQAMRQRAEDARRVKEQFVANVSHELRTPLNMIIGFIEMMMQTPAVYGRNMSQSLLADLDIVLRNSRHLSSLIDDVLDLSQIEAEQMALTKEQVVLAEIIEAGITAVQPLFHSKGLYLCTEVPANLPPVLCDRTRIRQVVLNLLSNAGRFTEQGGVHIRAWQAKHNIVVSVTDTGPGIAPEAIQKIFQPFQQLDNSLHRHHGGSGLGLSISKSFIELHQGHMWVESQAGVGTTFSFCLPLEIPAAEFTGVSRWVTPDWEYKVRTRRSQAPLPVVRPRLVVLESGNLLQRLLTRYLTGVEIIAVATLDAAIQELAREQAQALLINEISVSESLQRLELAVTLPYGTPAIICSVPGIQEAAGAMGVTDYLVKPVAREVLLETLARLHMQGKTILLVDNEPDALRLYRRMLAASGDGYRVLRASGGRQALDILRTQRPDLLLLDLIMPDMDGFQLLAEKRLDPDLRDIPVVVLSARDPAGQPIVCKSLAVLRGGGISVHRLLTGIEAVIKALSPQPFSLRIQHGEEEGAAEGFAEERRCAQG